MQLSSKNQTILLLSDCHQEIDKLNNILKKENYDICVHLGDFFDSFIYNSRKDLEKTCEFIKKWIVKDNFYTLTSNHDIQYLYPENPSLICSGYEPNKAKFVKDFFGENLKIVRNKFLWYLWVDDFLCSHAGINPYYFPATLNLNKTSINNWLNRTIEEAEIKLVSNQRHWLYGAGVARYGKQKIGGIIWQDFNNEFEPIEEIKQIVGHTPGINVRPHHSEGSLDIDSWQDICIDCHLNQYLKIFNGKIKISSTKGNDE